MTRSEPPLFSGDIGDGCFFPIPVLLPNRIGIAEKPINMLGVY